MTAQTIVIAVPEETSEPLLQSAGQLQLGVEETALAAMQSTPGQGTDEGSRAHQVLAALETLDTDALWQLVRRATTHHPQ
jgi:hypothetical protein